MLFFLRITFLISLLVSPSVVAQTDNPACTGDDPLTCNNRGTCVQKSANFSAFPFVSYGTSGRLPPHEIDNINGQSCLCDEGWTGVKCGTAFQFCNDGEHVCLNNGACVSGAVDATGVEVYICNCLEARDEFSTKHIGLYCEMPLGLFTVIDMLSQSSNHTTLRDVVAQAPMSSINVFQNEEGKNLTIFAPDDTAFSNFADNVGTEFINDLFAKEEWSRHLVCFLDSHVLETFVNSSSIIAAGPMMNVTSIWGIIIHLDVAQSGSITVDGNPVTDPDITIANGVVHSISGLPILPSCINKSLFDIVDADNNLTTLASLVVNASLVEALRTMRPLTLMAPSNDAFAKVPATILDYLGRNITALTEVLTYHILASGNEFFGVAENEGSFTTLQGDNVTITSTTINNVTVFTSQNVLASNGVFHVIDSLLLPPSLVLIIPTNDEAPSSAPSLLLADDDSEAVDSRSILVGTIAGALLASLLWAA